MKKAALIAGGILLSLLVVEIFLRMSGFGMLKPELHFDLHARTAFQQGQVVTDNQLFWRQPDGPYPPFESQHRIVHVDDPVPIKGRKFRILCLGDSCTRLSGRGLPYSALLERELNPEWVEVFNASMPGYSSYQGLTWLRTQLLQYEPDLVVVYFGWNDHWRSTGRSDRQYAASLKPGSLRLLDLLRRSQNPPPVRVSLSDYESNLRQIADLVSRGGGRTLFLTAPYNFTERNTARLLQDNYVTRDDRLPEIHERYLQVVRSLNGFLDARVFDVAAHFQQTGDLRTLLSGDGIHLTENGHLVLAVVLSEFIARSFLKAPVPASDPAAKSLVILAQNLASTGRWDQAVLRYRRAIQLAPDESESRVGLAWLLSTCLVDSVRDGEEALALLAQLSESDAANPQVLNVRSAALAETGRYELAAETMRQAISMLDPRKTTSSQMTAAFQERLALYESGRPYRVSPLSRPQE